MKIVLGLNNYNINISQLLTIPFENPCILRTTYGGYRLPIAHAIKRLHIVNLIKSAKALKEAKEISQEFILSHTRVLAKVKLDGTGRAVLLPTILFLNEGKVSVLEPLLRYFIFIGGTRSRSWMNKLCEIVSKLLDYIAANFERHDKPVGLFLGFTNALYNGTFDENLQDPSGLCWLPSRIETVNPKLYSLQEFSDWMVREGYVPNSLNTWRSATNAERRFNWVAWYRKNEYSFLGHLGLPPARLVELEQAREVKLQRTPAAKVTAPKAFPSDFEVALLRDGFVRPGKENETDLIAKFDWRGICITMLLLYGAKRISEVFHLWVGDVMENPNRPGEALVRIYHPTQGMAPENPKVRGKRAANRQAYLQAFYPKYSPRNLGDGNYHTGFKGRAFTDDNAKYIQIYWLPSFMAEAFLWAYVNYMKQRARLGIDGSKHPFAFVSHHAEYRGEPFTIKGFENSWERAVRRIGLLYGKAHGTSPHGGRHASGLRANRAGVSPYDAQEMFAHSSIESQRTYRIPTPEQITDSLNAATQRLQDQEASSNANTTFSALSMDWTTIWK